jgi:hypothetical protein
MGDHHNITGHYGIITVDRKCISGYYENVSSDYENITDDHENITSDYENISGDSILVLDSILVILW